MFGSLVGIAILAVLAGMGWVKRAGQVRRLEALIRDAREVALVEMAYAEPDARWSLGLDLAGDVPAGMTVLGDRVEQPAGRPISGAMRWFADADGTTYGWIAAVGPRHVPTMLIMSSTAAEHYVTRHIPAAGGALAAPPFSHRDDAPYAAGRAAAVTRHRERVRVVAGLVAVKTADDMQKELARLRGKVIAWRQAQPPAALLDADLRSILGRRYDQLAPRLRPRLGAVMPEARVV